jgi:hypothetical protein
LVAHAAAIGERSQASPLFLFQEVHVRPLRPGDEEAIRRISNYIYDELANQGIAEARADELTRKTCDRLQKLLEEGE